LGWSAPNTTTNDNGILQTAVVSEGGPSIRSQLLVFSQLFGYDMANRLTAAIDTNWTRTFHYDTYGNMSVSANGGAPLNGLTPQWQNNVDPFDPATNRLLAGGYDAAGNQAVMGSLSMWRDAENRQYQTWDSITNVLVNYLYDSEGRRVQKTMAGGATTDYVYDALGQLAAEYTGAGAVSKEYIRLGGQLVATENAAGSPCTTCYLSYDHLGSVRLVTDQNANVVARHEYLPFGEALDGWAGRTGSGWGTFDNVNQRFTGQERDSETNLDFFQARYFGAALGRFTTPDEPFAGQYPNDPQSWNLYSYGLNNPLRYTDPDGHDAQDPCGDNPNCVTATAPYPGLSPLDELLYRSFFNNLNTALQIGQQTQQIAQQTFDWLSAPRDPGCMTAHTMGGAGVGMAGGAVAGAVFGPADVLTVPMGAVTGYVGGAAFGRIGGLISCMSGSGGTGGSSGQGTGGNQPPLKKLHSDSTLSKTSLDFWRKKSTQEIVDSLRPGNPDALRVKPDGTIMNGNTRVTILQERGFDVNSLPRELH
jgi:RHS repeat-associated protein